MINVLVVDDDAMVAELNRCYIGQIDGFICCGTASTLLQAKERLLQTDPAVDLILLDIYMQQENGLDLLPELRSAGRPIDVIIISSAADAATIKTSLNYGVVDYLIKPFQFSRFEEALTGWRQKNGSWIIISFINNLMSTSCCTATRRTPTRQNVCLKD